MSHYECKQCGRHAAHCGCLDPFKVGEKKPKPEFIPRKERDAVKMLKGLGYVVYKRV